MTNKRKLKQRARSRSERNDMSYSSALEIEKGTSVEPINIFDSKDLFEKLTPEYLEKATELTYHWSRAPGEFVNKLTGEVISFAMPKMNPNTFEFEYEEGHKGPQFTGTVREWYETLIETIIDLYLKLPGSNKIENAMGLIRRQGEDCKAYASPDVMTLIEQSMMYKSYWSPSEDYGDPYVMGTIATRPISLYKSSIIPRNVMYMINKKGHVGKLVVEHLNVI